MFFSFYFTGKNDDFTLMRCEQGFMEVETKIELLAGLECIATKTLATLETNHLEILETIDDATQS